MVKYAHHHNHPIDGVAVLRHKDGSPEVKEQVIALLKAGHGPASAFAAYKQKLRQAMDPEAYGKVCADRSIVPDYEYVRS